MLVVPVPIKFSPPGPIPSRLLLLASISAYLVMLKLFVGLVMEVFPIPSKLSTKFPHDHNFFTVFHGCCVIGKWILNDRYAFCPNQ